MMSKCSKMNLNVINLKLLGQQIKLGKYEFDWNWIPYLEGTFFEIYELRAGNNFSRTTPSNAWFLLNKLI